MRIRIGPIFGATNSFPFGLVSTERSYMLAANQETIAFARRAG